MIHPTRPSRPSPAMGGPHPPPPYRAPPPLYNTPPSKPYSKFNVSEPNMGQAQGIRHNTFNNTTENGHQIQTNLRHLLASTPKHSTLDGQGQNVMLQHLRNSGLQQDTNKNNYGLSPAAENLRDTAHRMFNRGQTDRSSFGGVAINQDPSKRHNTHYKHNIIK